MKQLIIAIGIAAAVVSCGQTPEEKKKSKDETYMENAKTYVQSMIDKSTNPNDKNVLSIEPVKIDSIQDFNEYIGLEYQKNLLLLKSQTEMEQLQPLLELQELAGDNSGLSPALSQDLRKYEAEIKQIDAKMKTASKKKSGEIVYIKFKVKNKDATTDDVTMSFVFNEDLTLNGEMMQAYYGN